MAGAVAIPEDDDDENVLKLLDEPVSKIPDVEAAKERIRALIEDEARKTDYQSRLERKLLTLDTALAQQREEVESLQRTLELEHNKDAQDEESRKTERLQKTLKQEDRIRNYLADVLYRKAPPTKKKDEVFELDTVLISFVQPNNSIRYNLPFRVDGQTTLTNLRNDACAYWDVSTEDFILKTMGNSKCQNEILVKECFKQGEIAQLRLEQKNKEQTSITEAEYKAIAPKGKKSNRRAGKDKADLGADSVLKFTDRYASTLKKMGGIYFLLKLRDAKPSEHAAKIKPRDIFIYTLLAVLTFLIYFAQKVPGEEYWMCKGITDQLFISVPKPSYDPALTNSAKVPPFPEIREYDDVWDFLQITMPRVFWRNETEGDLPGASTDQTIATYNGLPGYIRIRQKTVKEAVPHWQHCDKFKRIVEALPGSKCPSIKMTEQNELKDNEHFEGLRRYWNYHLVEDKDTDFLRGPAKPWEFVSAEKNSNDHDIGLVHGRSQTYDQGGFQVEYRSELPLKEPAKNLGYYTKDMRELKQKRWIHNATTRAVFIDFNVYNYQYDIWAAVSLLLEFPASGQVVPSYEVRPFKPNLFETPAEYRLTYVLFIRFLIAGYITIVVGTVEMAHKTRNQKPGYTYYTSLNGICDVCISICICASIIVRFVKFNTEQTNKIMLKLDDTDKQRGFKSYADIARDFEWLFIMEGLIFLFTMFRLVSLYRINRTIYLFWHTIGMVFKQGVYMCFLFCPTLLFFTVIAHRIWGAETKAFATMGDSFIAVYHMTKGALNVSHIIELDTILAGTFYGLLYIFVTFLLLTSFAVIFVESYYVVQLTATGGGDPFTYDKFRNWLIHPVLLSCFHFALPGGGSQESAPTA